MGLTTQRLVVKESHRARRTAQIDFLIDSGAVSSLVPGVTLRSLGIRPHRRVEFTLADGRATTLESLGLVLDPFTRRLLPMRLLLVPVAVVAEPRKRAR